MDEKISVEKENLNDNKAKVNQSVKSNNKNLIIIITLLIIVIIVSGIYFGLVKKDAPLIIEHGELNVYCKKNFDDCWLTTVESEGGNKIYTIETESANPTVVGGNYDIILFDDNGLKVFTKKNKLIKKIDLENKYSFYDVLSSNGSFVGIVYKSDNTSGYYDYKTNKTLYGDGKLLNDAYNERYILYLTNNKISIYDKVNSKMLKENINLENNYTEYKVLSKLEVDKNGFENEERLIGIFAINESDGNSIYYCLENNTTMYKNTYSNIYLETHNDYLIGQKNLNTGAAYDTVDYILDPTEEKIVFSPSNTKKHMSFRLEKYNGKYYFIESTNLIDPYYYTKGIIYSNEKKLIDEVNYYPGDYRRQDYMINDQGELIIRKDNTINKYDIDGKLLDSKTYGKVFNINSGFLVVVNNGKILIEDSDFRQLAEVIEWKDSYKIDKYPPLFIKEDFFGKKTNGNFVSGLYMVLEDGKNYTEYCFIPKDNQIVSRKIDNFDNYDLSIYWEDVI